MPVSESTKLENSRDFYRDFNESGYTKEKRGPTPTGKGVPVVVRLQPPDLSALDEWIKGQDNDVSRPEAVRRLLAQALQKKR
jgi:hypothetical protein